MLKKIISIILAAVMGSMISIVSVNAKSDVCDYGHGDVNNDGVVSMIDVTNMQKYIASLISFSGDEKYAGDVTGDSVVKMDDVTEVQRYIADLIKTFPACANEGNENVGDGTVTIDGTQYKAGDTFTYKLLLNCDEGDVTAINSTIIYDNSLLTIVDYSFPVITDIAGIDPVVNNNRTNSLLAFTASSVDKSYKGFSFKGQNNCVVSINFKVNNISESANTKINYEIKELFKLTDEGYIDFFIDNIRVPGYEKTVNFSYEIVK